MGIFLGQIASNESGLAAGSIQPRARSAHEFIISGVILLVIGVIFGGWGGVAFLATRHAIEKETYIPAIWPMILLTLVIVVGGLSIVALVFWRALELTG